MISLLMPTMNRSEFVIRLLHYYANFNFKHTIFIGDSSHPEEFEKTNKVVRSLKGKLKVEHFHYPNVNNYVAVDQLIQNATTPYVCFLPDDDFFVPESIEKCIDFLEDNPDYSCAWGKTIMFKLEKSGAHGKFHALSRANPDLDHSVDGESVIERLHFHAENYASVFVGVCRRALLRKALRNSVAICSSAKTKDNRWGTAAWFGELVTSFSMVVQGKGKSLDCVYWIRQDHDRRYTFPGGLDWLTCSNWLCCYEISARQIMEDIMEKEGLSAEEAEKVWKEAFQVYVSLGFQRFLKKRNIPSKMKAMQGSFKKRMRQRPGLYLLLKHLREGWRLTRLKLMKSNEVFLCTALNRSSSYHKDFMPIYELVSHGNPVKD